MRQPWHVTGLDGNSLGLGNIIRSDWRMILSISALSVIARTIPLIWITRAGVSEVWDAYGYWYRATGIYGILQDFIHGVAAQPENKLIAYSNTWPPGQAGILAVSYLPFGPSLLVGRVAMVAISVATVPLVYLLTRKLSGKAAATAAALVFALYPSFIHSALRLQSENAFILLSLAAILLSVMCVEEGNSRRSLALAAMTGVVLGVCGLVRAAVLPWIPALALWVGWRSDSGRQRILRPVIMLVVCMLCLLPWEIVLYRQEGRLIPIAASGEENLFRGNNPWIPEGLGSSGIYTWDKIQAAGREYTQIHGVTDKEAYRRLAIDYVSADPLGFIVRGFYKLRDLWTPDTDLILWFLLGIYPPTNHSAVGLLTVITIVGLPIVSAFAAIGMSVRRPALRHAELFILLLLTNFAVIFVTIGEESRFHIPLIAIFLPAIGHGLIAALNPAWELSRAAVVAGSLAFAVISYTSLVNLRSFRDELLYLTPSSYYLPLMRQAEWLLGQSIPASDRFLFRANDAGPLGEISLAPDGPEQKIVGAESVAYHWNPMNEPGLLNVVALSPAGTKEPVRLLIMGQGQEGATQSLQPTTSSWQRWQPTGIDGLDYMWVGSSFFPDKSNLGRATALGVSDWSSPIVPFRNALAWDFKRFD